MVSVITAVLLAISWITAIASAGGMFFRDTLPVHPLAHFTAAIVATVALGVAWVAYSALGRQLSRHWTLPFRGLAVLGYWVLIGATFADPGGMPVDCSILCRYVSDANNGAIYGHGRGFLSR